MAAQVRGEDVESPETLVGEAPKAAAVRLHAVETDDLGRAWLPPLGYVKLQSSDSGS
jgi:hypothetical protein